MSILTLDQVSKTFQAHKAVDRVSFSVPQGCIYGLLGPNGAGKTTTIRMITGITHPDSGDIHIKGKKVNNTIPQEIGYMPEERGLYKKMTVWDHLMYLAQLKGMTQKAQFIATVIHKPEILILDEPFSGLDPISTNMIKDEIERLKSIGTTIIFSTHRMEQVEEICERMVLINKGQNVLEGNVEEIRKANREHLFRLTSESDLPTEFPIEFNERNRVGKKVYFKPLSNISSSDLLRYFINKEIHVTSFEEIFPSINDIFIQTVEKSNQL
jgi:ABC-2 type transport system ATP-binding protein